MSLLSPPQLAGSLWVGQWQKMRHSIFTQTGIFITSDLDAFRKCLSIDCSDIGQCQFLRATLVCLPVSYLLLDWGNGIFISEDSESNFLSFLPPFQTCHISLAFFFLFCLCLQDLCFNPSHLLSPQDLELLSLSCPHVFSLFLPPES